MLKMQPPPQATPEFVPTDPSQQVAQADPNAVLEAERNTALRSQEKGTTDSSLPQLSGNPRAGLNYENSPRSVEQPNSSQPTPPIPVDPTQAEPPSKPTPESKPLPPTPKTEREPEPASADPKALPVLPSPYQPPQPATKPQPDRPETKPPSPTPPNAKPTPPSPPPTPYSFQREKSRIEGGRNADIGAPSPAAKESELGRYKAKVYRAIGSRWYISVEKNMAVLALGEAKIKFFVRANGTIDQIEVIDSTVNAEVLRNLSIRSVKDSQPFEVFSDSLKQQLGEGYWEEITFTIY